MEAGITNTLSRAVTTELTAKAIGSGELDVLATPAVAALVEECAWKSVAPELEEGQGSVGTLLELAHTAATPVGMEVSCTTTLTEVDRRRLVFSFTVSDAAGEVAHGTHERFVVQNDRFQAKADAKRA